ncbi:MAG TPA: ATP-binding cassette domain-containing protein [Terrimicrobiaceae bacterium]
MNSVLSCEALCCRRINWDQNGEALVRDVTLCFSAATLSEFDGPDNASRDLLLNNLGLLEPADSGTIFLDGQQANDLAEEDRRHFRNKYFGFLFENPCLLPSFSVAENVAMPLFRICGIDAAAARDRTLEVLDFCGIAHLENQLAGRLASSAQRKAALARALVHRPKVLVSISPRGSDELFDLAFRVTSELGLCVLWAAHDRAPSKGQRLIRVQEGRISSH